ncbi:hypothetical protein D3C87_1293050 [compost metagenome]
MHCGVVIPGRNAFDVIATVVRLDRAFRTEHHTGRHGRFAAGVTDVVALETLRRFIQLQHFRQRIEACRDVLTIRQARAQGLFGVGHRQLLPARSRTAHPVTDGQFATTQLVDGRDQCRKILMNHVDDQLAWQVALRTADEVLAQKRRHDFGNVFFNTDLREKILAAQHSSAAHADQVHTGAARVDERSDYIDISRPAFHALLVLNPAQQRDLVAQLSGTLELKVDRRLFHAGGQLVCQRIAATFKEHHRVPYIFGIHLRLNQPDTRCLAALDLVLQARTRTVLVIAVFTLANEKCLLQQAQAFANSTGAGIRTEVFALGLFRTAMDAQTRERPVG